MRGPSLAMLLCVASLTSACRSGGTVDSSQKPPPEPADAGGAGNAGDASTGPSHDELLEIFLEAARTNLERPYPSSQPDAPRQYADAAGALLSEDPFALRRGRTTASIVAEVLARSEDERSGQALMEWAANPAARRHVAGILSGMGRHPRAAYLPTCRAVVADAELAREIVGPYGISGDLLAKALWMNVRASVHVMAMELAVALPGRAGKEWVRTIAMDRTASAPDPRTLAALTCSDGEVRIEIEAQALASRRIMALSTLADRALLGRVATDPNELALVRYWAQRMLRGGPDLTRPDWESHLDWRQRQAYEHSMLEFVGRDTSPCLIVHPRPHFPDRGVESPAPPPAMPPALQR